MGMIRVVWRKDRYHTGVRYEDEVALLIMASLSNTMDSQL